MSPSHGMTDALAIATVPSRDPVIRCCVRVLAMVHERYKAGYQRLRVLPFMSPSGAYWRAWITHVDHVEPDGYTFIDTARSGKGSTGPVRVG